MKQIITHYERELLDLLTLQISAANLILRQTKSAIEHVLLVDDADEAAQFVLYDALYCEESLTVDELIERLELAVADPLTEDNSHVES